MPENTDKPSPEVQSDSPAAATPSPAADNKVSLDINDLKSFLKTTVEEVLKSKDLEATRKQAEEYNSKISEAVNSSQASIIKPNTANGQIDTDYVKRVIEEDNRLRMQSGEGKARYSDKGEDFLKAKIIVLKKIGLSEEEIAKELKDAL